MKHILMLWSAMVILMSSGALAQDAGGSGGPGGGGGGDGGGGGNGSAMHTPQESIGAEALLNPTLFPPTIYGAVRGRDLSRWMLNPSTPVLVTDLDRSHPTYFERWQRRGLGGGSGGYEE